MSKHAGFTIIELMIVITIGAILAALAMPGIKEWTRNGNRTAVTTTLLSSLHLARSEAVKRNARVSLCPSDDPTEVDAKCSGNKDWASGWIVFVDVDSDMDHASDATEEVLATVSDIHNAFTIITTQGETAMSYRANGRAISDGKAETMDFNVCDDRGASEGRVISITNSGRPQTGRTAADGTDPQC